MRGRLTEGSLNLNSQTLIAFSCRAKCARDLLGVVALGGLVAGRRGRMGSGVLLIKLIRLELMFIRGTCSHFDKACPQEIFQIRCACIYICYLLYIVYCESSPICF